VNGPGIYGFPDIAGGPDMTDGTAPGCLSSPCAVATRFGPESGHGDCCPTEDMPLHVPHHRNP